MSVHHYAVLTPREAEYDRELRRVRRQRRHLYETHPCKGNKTCQCPICTASVLAFVELLKRPPCPACRGVGAGCLDCDSTGWTPA